MVLAELSDSLNFGEGGLMTEQVIWIYSGGVSVMAIIMIWAGTFLCRRSARDRYLKILLDTKSGLSFFHLLEQAACLSGPYQLDCLRLLKMAKTKKVGWKLVAAIVGRYLVETDKICTQWGERQQRYFAIAENLLDFFGLVSDKEMKFILMIPCSSEDGQFSRRSLLLAIQDVREIRQWQAQVEATKLVQEQKGLAYRRVVERGQAIFNPATVPVREKVIFPKAVAVTQEAGP